METLNPVLVALREVEEDSLTPKNVKHRIASTIQLLSEDAEQSIKVNKALQELEGLAEDSNVQSETRMQIFNIVSLLEVV